MQGMLHFIGMSAAVEGSPSSASCREPSAKATPPLRCSWPVLVRFRRRDSLCLSQRHFLQ